VCDSLASGRREPAVCIVERPPSETTHVMNTNETIRTEVLESTVSGRKLAGASFGGALGRGRVALVFLRHFG